MRYSVSELAKLCQCSVRTLHYYDEIGLLRPSEVTDAGYRYYDEEAKAALLQILFYRELELPLRDIARMRSCSETERRDALRAHRALLRLKRQRLDELLRAVDDTLEGKEMKEPNTTAANIQAAKSQYAGEVRDRWGQTEEYRQSEQKSAARTEGENARMTAEMEEIFSAFAAAMDSDPAGPEAHALVARWQDHITRYHYACTKPILAGLGEMYTADERFMQNIDRHGDGTAAFMRDAIRAYCKD